jgi:dolichol-phosphate mannosyltransferase
VEIDPASAPAATVESEGLLLSVVVPTFEVRKNVPRLVDRLSKALVGIRWEVIFVDDNSPDGTGDEIRNLASRNSRVRRIVRVGRRGLSGAAVEGMLASTATYVAVMDGDLQHDERLLRSMIEALEQDRADIVVGS